MEFSNLDLWDGAKVLNDKDVQQIGSINNRSIWYVAFFEGEPLVCVGEDPRLADNNELYETHELYGQSAPEWTTDPDTLVAHAN